MTVSPSVENSDNSFALITPTYLPDLARCELLAESLDRVAPHLKHYLIVDRRDIPAFRHLVRGSRSIIESEALIGKYLWRMPGRKGFWLSWKALPVRGWIVQQILKIAAIELVSERTLVFCDSDVAFFRSFHRGDLLIGGKVGLLDVDFVNDDIRRWTSVARRLLGLRQRHDGNRNHVGNMICWNRETVKAMQQRIETIMEINWQIALARTSSFSEYMLYGIFVREVLGYNGVDHSPSARPLVKPSWGVELTNDTAVDAFFSDFDPKTVAIMVHSKDNYDPLLLRRYLERQWRSAD